ncbi:MAG: aldo/keto reductase [Clostridiales bacterium]|nr:aldo/keto reductase [Clostridiales bacterium]
MPRHRLWQTLPPKYEWIGGIFLSYLGEDIKKLGFGLMRLPQQNDVIDIEQTKQMVDLFIKAGFTYFDTAWAYAGSEDAIRQALVERYPRQSYQLATKNAAWINCKTKEDAIDQFETSLKRTGAGYFDFYLLHNLGESRTRFFDDFDMWAWVQQKKQEGLIKHIGFSFHSTPEELEGILLAHPEMEFVQLQINYADWENPAVQSKKCYEVARKFNKPVIIMEPVKGGMLATPPASVLQVLNQAEPDSSAASWAIRFAASLDGIITVLSGMSSVAQMQDNISYMKDFHGLTPAQQATLSKAQEELAKIPLIPCTTCNYCAKVCPQNIGISGSFTAMNYLTLYGDKAAAAHQENWLVGGHGKKQADQCIQCGKCESVCPRHIKIRDNLALVKKALL